MSHPPDLSTWNVVTDLDGTLIMSGTLPDSREVRRFRHLVVGFAALGYATGRSYEDARALVDRCQLPVPDFWVCELGLEVRDPHGALLRQVDPNLVADLHQRSRGWPLDGSSIRYIRYQSRLRLDVGDRRAADALLERLQALGECCVLTAPNATGTYTVDVLPAGIGKGEGISTAQKALGLRSKYLYFGDAHNDLTALKAAGLAFLMPSAPEDVRRAAARAMIVPGNGIEGVNRVLGELKA